MTIAGNNVKEFTTFGIEAKAREIHTFSSVNELKELLNAYSNKRQLILGGGSNVLFTQDFDGLIFINRILGIESVFEDDTSIHLKVGAGVVWHEFVLHCVNKGFGGIENLSLIPGSVGASPMQNIGAYGVEIKDVFVELEALNKTTLAIETFDRSNCEFGYRESVFKRALKDKYIITSVTFKLSKIPVINSSYGAINTELSARGIENPTIKDISDVVIAIRQSKLPDPKEIGNAGSFFKNPVVPMDILREIQKNYSEIPNYPVDADHVKLAAGWLIEKAGWKGKTYDNYGVHKKQALVLVNYGGAKGKDLYELSENIILDIQLKFGITLEREVNMI
jgi:UDP-N-acetylmuramate dehydrogenase